MPTFWDFLPASLWLTQPFIPPVDPGQRSVWMPNSAGPWESPASTPDYLVHNATASLGPWNDDRYQQMLADAKRASDFIAWHFGRPSREPLPLEVPPMPEQPAPVPRERHPKPPSTIESAPLGPPVPPDGYNEWDKLNQFYEDPHPETVDPRIMARDADPYRTLDNSTVIDPQTILAPQFYCRKRVP